MLIRHAGRCRMRSASAALAAVGFCKATNTRTYSPPRRTNVFTLPLRRTAGIRGSSKERGRRGPETLKQMVRSIERQWGVQSKMRIFT